MSSIIFYGAGQNLHKNFSRWYDAGLRPVCIVDANISLQHTFYNASTGKVKILPLLEAITAYPDYCLYLTQVQASISTVANYLLNLGIPQERIRHCDTPSEAVQTVSLAITSMEYKNLYPQMYRIFSALQDDISRTFFMGRIEYSLSHSLTGLYKAMTHKGYLKWIESKTSYAYERYGLHGFWELLNNNYPAQKNEIYLYGGFGGAFTEYKWLLERFMEAAPKLGITFSGCILADNPSDAETFMGIPCISESDFISRITDNTRLLIGIPGWCLQTEEIVRKFSAYKDLLVPIADTAQPQYFEADIFPPQEDEIFVDVGVYNLDSSIDFSRWAVNGYQKIYAFEPDPVCFQKSLKRLKESGELETEKVELVNKGLSATDGVLPFPATYNPTGNYTDNATIDVETASLDSYLQGRPVTFVKMDVEGAEMDVLLGMQETIRQYKPKLAVCIYHKHEDIFEIASFILSLVPEYKLYIRHYNSNETEEVLLCTI